MSKYRSRNRQETVSGSNGSNYLHNMWHETRSSFSVSICKSVLLKPWNGSLKSYQTYLDTSKEQSIMDLCIVELKKICETNSICGYRLGKKVQPKISKWIYVFHSEFNCIMGQ